MKTTRGTRPIGVNMQNIPVTMPHSQVAGLDRLCLASGVGRSPYLREVAQWCIDNDIILRPIPAQFDAAMRKLAKDGTPPEFGYELVAKKAVKIKSAA